MNNTDALFRFAMSEDAMKLGVSRYFPPNGGEEPSVELLRRQVAEAGVQLPIDENAAQQIIDAISKNREIPRIALVKGIPAQEPQDASLVALGDLDYPVFPGDRFARLHPAKEAAEGQTIDGKRLKPQRDFKPKSIEVKMGENVEHDPLTNAYVSQVWGMARLKEGTISVDPIPHISEDAITITGNIYGKDFRGNDITPAQVEKEMRDMGVVIDIDTDMLDQKLRRARSAGTPLIDQIITQGAHPVPGRDGWLEYLVSTREDTGTEDESGRLDFRDKGAYPLVEPGQIVARLHAPTSGEGGIDLYGKTIPAHGGKELRVHLGENVLVHEDKKTFEAKAKGVMVMERGTLSVTDCLIIPGNVDLASGNVKLEHGSVKILGSIQAGFIVTAPKHVIVAGSIESATVEAGGNIEVSGGILMPEGGKIKAKGDVIANYTTNALIEAGGDVHIANDVTNTEIHAEGHLFATRGKGHVQGGHIVTAKGMSINEAGSDLGVATNLTVRIDSAEDEHLRQKRLKIKQAIAKINDALGNDSAEAILKRTPPKKRVAVAEVLKHRIHLVARRKEISEQINQIQLARQEKLAGIKIKVNRLLHPGTTIKFGAKSHIVARQTEASVLYWDENSRSIVTA
ncbi:FapA family protein [uncultured Pseudodesulfovibrio sp.]|uniref:FapA family protein n=1 Tax=uncultured Pseudodesulfovibrio sp. TaxID=2035858 RepID=UPI0029C795D7|nr:FapA family protein [uncultured Pseudodesulfovibrio sp.]